MERARMVCEREDAMNVRVRGDGGLVLAELVKKGDKMTWQCPYGGQFSPEEIAEIDAFARGHASSFTVNRGTRWERRHWSARVEVR